MMVFRMLLLAASWLGLSAAAVFAAQTVIWLEAEQFARPGGWSNDPQFVDLMGSPYLLANGVGRPVEDAVTQAQVPAVGAYRLWVRCKDWLPEHSPGRFQVSVGGKASDTTFGARQGEGWQWVDGGRFDLPAGQLEVRLHDLTGWWGRCDAVVLATDFAPSSDADELAGQRIRYGGVSQDVERKGPCDVVVVGGGLAGCAAAVAAARQGCSVALIQDRPVLGGNTSSEIMVPVGGDQSNEPLDPRETGIAEEFDPGPGRGRGRSDLIEKVVRAEPNIALHLDTRATGVVMRDKATIDGVLATHVRTGRRMLFAAPLFVDATGDGWIGFWAGAEFRQGREARAEFNEPLAPEQADSHTMGNSLHNAQFREHKGPVPFECPPWAYRWKSPRDFETTSQGSAHIPGTAPPANFKDLGQGAGRRPDDKNGGLRHVWWVELGGMHDTIRDAEWIRDELLRISIGLWNYAKNYDERFVDANRNRELVWLNYVPGKRESRRLMGDYLMTQADFAQKTVHPDTVAYGGWTIDVHHPQGFWVKGPGAYHAYRHKVSIPYRSLYSKDIRNLFMAGRNVSCTHVALGGIRVMRTTCLMGQAVGTAAAVARRHDTTPRGVYQHHVAQVQQQLLRDGCYLMGVKSEDPLDLARTASASASSVMTYDDPKDLAQRLPHGGVIHAMDCHRAVMFVAPADRLDSAAFYLRSERDTPATVTATLCPAKAAGDFSDGTALATAKADVPPRSKGWVAFPLAARLEQGRRYCLWLTRTDGLKWDLYAWFPPDTSRAYGGPTWTPMRGCYKFRLEPGGEPPRADAPGRLTMAPDHVIDGWNRAVQGAPHAWAPDPQQPLPQWVALDFGRAVALGRVHVTFQTDDHAPEAFRIDAWQDGAWRTVAAIGRAQRRHVIRFEPVTSQKVRVVLLRARADARCVPAVCEVRVYEGGPARAAGGTR